MGDSPGWDAIEEALKPVYGDREPLHFGTAIPYELGGPDPIRGLSAYRRSDPDHWHFVTYGFTELFGKEIDDKEVSGYGFELTMRVSRPADEARPPAWAMNLLQNLGRYVFKTGNAFGIGHHMPTNSPLCLGAETDLWALTFGRDPELKEISGPNGKAEFLQVVGIALDELDLIQEWDSERFLAAMAEHDRFLLTDLARKSLLADPARAAALRAKADAEGSSMSFSFFKDGAFHPGPPFVWEVGALYIKGLLRGLKGRLLHDRDFHLSGPTLQVHFIPDAKQAFGASGDELTLRVSPELAKEMLATLRAQRGEYRWEALPGFSIRVVPSEIHKQDGSVESVVG